MRTGPNKSGVIAQSGRRMALATLLLAGMAFAARPVADPALFTTVGIWEGALMIEDGYGATWRVPVFPGCDLMITPSSGRSMPTLKVRADTTIGSYSDEQCVGLYRKPANVGTVGE